MQEEALKTECERLRNNLLAEIHNQNDGELTNQINMLKQQHEIEVRQLKQSFRSKLERINEMKKRLLEEEKIKRENIEVRPSSYYDSIIGTLVGLFCYSIYVNKACIVS